MLNTKTIEERSVKNNYNSEEKRLLSTWQRKLLQSHLSRDLRPEYRRRLQIMLMADLGQSYSEIASALDCSNETARHWISILKAGEVHKWQELPIGRPKKVNQEYLDRLKELVTKSPREFGYGFRRWTARWLSRHLAKELAIEISDRHVNRLLKKMDLTTKFNNSNKSKVKNIQPVSNFGIKIDDLDRQIKSNADQVNMF